MEQSEGREPDIIPLSKEEGYPVHSNYLHPVRPAEKLRCITCCIQADWEYRSTTSGAYISMECLQLCQECLLFLRQNLFNGPTFFKNGI